jgi:CDP-4-dehydro-6-deoxyglucose reductase
MPELRVFTGEAMTSCQVEPDRDLLEQLIGQNLPVDYSCRRGDCGQCVATLVSGTVRARDPGRPCRSAEGIYLCNALAASDLELRLPHCAETAAIRRLRSPCKIDRLRLLSAEVMELSLRLPPATRFEFVPGQYIRLGNREGIARSYSLAAPPAQDRRLLLHVRRVPGGPFSDYLFLRARDNDLLHLEGPSGRFVLSRQRTVEKTLFLATGTGIAPIHAMLSALDPEQQRRCGRIFVYWGNRRRADAYLHERMLGLAGSLGLHYAETFSAEAAPGAYVQELMAAAHPDLREAQVLACGKAIMIEAARERSLGLGLPPERFSADPFTPS